MRSLSGSGKTSLLTLLRGEAYYARTEGKLIVNNRPVDNLLEYRNVLAFIPQDDIMYDELTVEENVMFAAILFNRRGYENAEEVKHMVDYALQSLAIHFIAKSIVGSPEKKGLYILLDM